MVTRPHRLSFVLLLLTIISVTQIAHAQVGSATGPRALRADTLYWNNDPTGAARPGSGALDKSAPIAPDTTAPTETALPAALPSSEPRALTSLAPVAVMAAAVAPSVTITTPTAGTNFRVPVDVPVAAALLGIPGFVHRVEFYANGVLIGTDLSSPYDIVWTNAGAGITVNTTYALTAKAFTLAGQTYTSDPVSVIVKPPFATGAPAPPATCKVANIVAFDQVFFYNRLGAVNPGGMIYALARDIVPIDSNLGLTPGNVRLRDGKRARPLVLRMNIGECIRINFQNLLAPDDNNDDTAEGNCESPMTPEQRRRCDQPRTRTASAHVQGLQLVNSILSDGSFVGTNPSSLVAPGGVTTYIYYADKEGANVMYSTAATTGGEGDGGSLANGLFGVVNVEPAGAEYYRSQLTRQEMQWASGGLRWPSGQPKINYDAVYPVGHQFAGKPILRMTVGNEIFHPDLNAIITGPNRGNFAANTYPANPTEPNRNKPFREFTVVYHDEIVAVQAFPQMEDTPGNPLAHTLHSVRDGFAINYGTGGIGAEVFANRFNVGPMHNCPECLYEEFFLSAWTVGDPAMIVDVPGQRDATAAAT